MGRGGDAEENWLTTKENKKSHLYKQIFYQANKSKKLKTWWLNIIEIETNLISFYSKCNFKKKFRF